MDIPYYTNTTQCQFFNGEKIEYGITFHEYTISAETGIPYLNAECKAAALSQGFTDWIRELEWFDLTKYRISDLLKF